MIFDLERYKKTLALAVSHPDISAWIMCQVSARTYKGKRIDKTGIYLTYCGLAVWIRHIAGNVWNGYQTYIPLQPVGDEEPPKARGVESFGYCDIPNPIQDVNSAAVELCAGPLFPESLESKQTTPWIERALEMAVVGRPSDLVYRRHPFGVDIPQQTRIIPQVAEQIAFEQGMQGFEHAVAWERWRRDVYYQKVVLPLYLKKQSIEQQDILFDAG